MGPAGVFYIDGMDLWTVFGMVVEDGTDDFLKYAAKKESITHDWSDSHGIDVDLTQVFLKEREISLRICFIAENEVDFGIKYNAFIAQMILAGPRRLEPKGIGDKQFFCYYKECTNFTRYTKPIPGSSFVGVKFTVTFVDVNETFDPTVVFIVDEDGRYLVT